MNPLHEAIYDVIVEHANIPRSALTPGATLKDLDIDSLSAMEVIFGLEERFGINIPVRDPNFDTTSLAGLIATTEKLIAQKEHKDQQEQQAP